MPPSTAPVLGYILKGYPRISETFISNEILLLEKLGFSMHLFPMRQPRENFCHPSVKQIKAQVSYLPTELLPEFYRLLTPNIFLALKKPANYKKTLVYAKQGLSRGKELSTLKHLLQAGFLVNNHLLNNSNIGHLHGHFAHSPTSVTLFASLYSDIPFSFTAHAKDIYTSKKEKLRRKINQAKFVTTCTRHNKEYLENIAGTSTTPIHCIYHGIDLSLFSNEPSSREPSAPFKILTIARMTEKKGLPTIYKALAKAKATGLEFQHTLIGDGDDRDQILQLIKELGLEENCTWLGTQTHDEVLKHFKQSDLFVLGCKVAENGDRDGIPNVLVESLAMGVPAISTNVSAIPEILINEKTGITVGPEQPEQLSQSIQRVLSDRDLRGQIIAGGQDIVKQNFDNSKWISGLAGIFKEHCPTFDLTIKSPL
ncbi:MAG: glycosyltransferase family 4 protein [Desulfobulbaceae bacterium]|nr:glycosyltransferase family 4 protein [Desulfobulbaceae bacterium]